MVSFDLFLSVAGYLIDVVEDDGSKHYYEEQDKEPVND